MAKEKIHAVKNPFWLADTFIFKYFPDVHSHIYVKVNYRNKIEEIGVDLQERMHNVDISTLKVEEPTPAQKRAFNAIGEEYWWKLYNKTKKINYGNE